MMHDRKTATREMLRLCSCLLSEKFRVMFTGLVEETGEVLSLHQLREDGTELAMRAACIATDAAIGDSVAVNGCCLTVSACDGDALRFNLLDETLRRTNLGQLQPGSRVNLERALAATARLGGHFVQGHIDCTAPVRT